jgi:hypothetical protein
LLLVAQIIQQRIYADHEDPDGQDGEAPTDVVAADQKNARQDVAQIGNPARCDFGRQVAAFWMNIQARFDLETAEDALAQQIKKIASYEAA